MTAYVKSTNFASKDSLASGNPLKIVKGTEIDTEFNNIATAINTKADTADPTFTGVPLAPTASVGTSNTQIATTAFVTAAMQAVYPVGSIYINAGVSTNPATLLGFGTWASFGAGRVMVGVNAADPDFDTVEEIGGSKTHSHTTNTVSDHTHSVPMDGWGTGAMPSPSTAITAGRLLVGSGGGESVESLESIRGAGNNNTTGAAGSHSHTVSTSSNVQPYITVYMWKRTA